MAYFVTGATGFIGRFLVAELLENREGAIYCLCRSTSLDKLDALKDRLGDKDRIVAVVGDLAKTRLGVDDAEIQRLSGQIEHFIHLPRSTTSPWTPTGSARRTWRARGMRWSWPRPCTPTTSTR